MLMYAKGRQLLLAAMSPKYMDKKLVSIDAFEIEFSCGKELHSYY